MKNLVASIVLVFSLAFATAQVSTPAPSPFVKMEQSIGMSKVTLEYSRPGVKGRSIFGDLVPYDKIWRTGANQATKITFADDVVFNGSKLKKGTYALYTIPTKDKWTIMLNDDLTIGGNVARYSTDTEVHRSTAKSMQMSEKMESFMIFFDDLRDGSANLYIGWDKTIVQIPVEFSTDDMVMANIKRTMNGPSANDYYRAAVYYYNNDKDMDQAYEWINSATEKNPEAFWMATWKARILQKMGKKKDALTAARMALDLSKKAGNEDYMKINNDIIKALK
ncbi:MAG: DUF2911 domain-containing protein [Bacteroidia bacterium]|nr:DUF2911 domain-containing protein [Bacteroidia bacterium]